MTTHPELWSHCALQEDSDYESCHDPNTWPSPPLRLPRHDARRYVTCRLAATFHCLPANRLAVMPPPHQIAIKPRRRVYLPHAPRRLAFILLSSERCAILGPRGCKRLLCYNLLSRSVTSRDHRTVAVVATPGTSRIAPHAAMGHSRPPIPHPAPHTCSTRSRLERPRRTFSPHASRRTSVRAARGCALVLHLPLTLHPSRAAAPPRTVAQKKQRHADAGVPVLLGVVFFLLRTRVGMDNIYGQNLVPLKRLATSRQSDGAASHVRSYAVRWWVEHAKREMSVADDSAGKEDPSREYRYWAFMVHGDAPGACHTARREAMDILTLTWCAATP
ncbi:hypothetical protein GGX14DRAFT_634010 [Mycena pura]|uniref:Uncharacterized protein n=1 Tax=Mycena pura TaxID=153505 RepID=A0AAD6Y976_9AGAR|nr:hypothetical protein GGX14DRAFT_634010 [Mycena pura]